MEDPSSSEVKTRQSIRPCAWQITRKGMELTRTPLQTFSIEASSRAVHGMDVLQNAAQEVTGPTEDPTGRRRGASMQLPCFPRLSPCRHPRATLSWSPGVPWDDTENRGSGHQVGCQPGWTHMQVIFMGQQILENMWFRSNIIMIL